MWQVKRPPEIVSRLLTFDKPDIDIINSDLEMAAKVIRWVVLEGVVCTQYTHVGGCIKNLATVVMQARSASKQLAAANSLLRIIKIRR